MMALARKIVSGEEEDDDAESVEEVFAQASAEEYLVDDGWKLAEVDPETVEVNGIGPTVELVLGNGHAAIPANGNGHGHQGGPGAAAVAVLMGGVHGRGAGEAQGPQQQAPACNHLDVRVGAQSGAGSGAGRRGPLKPLSKGGRPTHSQRRPPLASDVCGLFCVSWPATVRSRRPGGRG